MAFNIIISEDPNYSRDLLNRSTRIKANLKVISGNRADGKTHIEVEKVFSSIDALNKVLQNIESYNVTRLLIYLEVSAVVDGKTFEFVQLGDSLPLATAAFNSGFLTYTYHGDPVFPYYGNKYPENPEIISGDLRLELIEKGTFETILQDEYSGSLPALSIDEVKAKVDALTSQYNQAVAALNAYKNQANAYVDFVPFNDKTQKFSDTSYYALNDISKQLNDITQTVLDNDSINVKVDSDISARYKAMVSANVQMVKLIEILNKQGFLPNKESFC